jgi:arylsulfatase A-like enzyme
MFTGVFWRDEERSELSIRNTERVRSIAGLSLQAGIIYSVFEGISYYTNFPVSSITGLFESSLRNLLIFFLLGMVSYFFLSIIGWSVRRSLFDPAPKIISLLMLVPGYFFLLHLLEGKGFIYHYIKDPKIIVLLLSFVVLILFFPLTRIMRARIAGHYSGYLAVTFFFITTGYRFVDWGSLFGGEVGGFISLLVIMSITLVLFVLVIGVDRLLRHKFIPAVKQTGLKSRLAVLLGLILILFAWIGTQRSRDKSTFSISSSPNILLVVLDSARMDRFSCYGYERETTPFLESFCEDATLFREAFTPAPWTMPSHASIFTGLYPSAHGMTWKNLRLDSRFLTLPDFLASKGYETTGFCNNPWVNAENGLARGFQTYVEMWKDEVLNPTLYYRIDWFLRRLIGRNDGGALRTHQWVLEWVNRDDRVEQPFFLFINLMECHLWYDAPDAYHQMFLPGSISPSIGAIHSNSLFPLLTGNLSLSDEEWGEFGDIYDGDLRYLDKRLEELFDCLSGKSFMDNTIIIVTSDHGEHLGEHQFVDHQLSLYEPLIQIPLIVKVPDRITGLSAIQEPIQSIDIFPTLMDLIGYHGEIDRFFMQGVSLVGRESSPHQFTVSEYEPPRERIMRFLEKNPEGNTILKYDRALRSIRIDSLKYIWSSDGNSELYNLALDPGESMDIGGELSEVANSMEDRLNDWSDSFEHAEISEREEGALDHETRQRLRALGYID